MKLRMSSGCSVATLFLGMMLSGLTVARAAEVDYVGYAWESGGLASSLPGDELSVAAVVTQMDRIFEVDLNAVEATLHIAELTSLGSSVNPSTAITSISYAGGTIAIYAGPARNHDWGVNPANATVPGTFVDGELIFEGVFTDFSIKLTGSGLGVFEGDIDAIGGSALAGPCSDCAYTFAGTFATPTGALIPAGYDLQVDGVLEVESTVAIETMSWGNVKHLFHRSR